MRRMRKWEFEDCKICQVTLNQNVETLKERQALSSGFFRMLKR